MTATTIPAPIEIPMAANLTGKSRDELVAMAEELSNRNYERFVKYNQSFIISKAYDDEYKADQQVILDQMAPILEALGPDYLEDCARGQQVLAAA